MKRYTFTVVPLDRNGVSRTLEMDGTETLDDLSSAILDACGGDHCHLARFSVTRKPYDDDGYYHPMAEKGAKADKIAIDSLELKSRRKMLYLYDFGDEWMFHVTVKKVVEADAPSPIRVAESRGELEQYPIWGEEEDWEEDSWEEENWEEDDWEEEDWEEEDLCVEFEDFYTLMPTINFQSPIDYTRTANGLSGRIVQGEFEYASDSNTQWLSQEDLRAYLQNL